MPQPADVPEAQTYYVAMSGNDNNPGTRDHPFRTINRSLSQQTPLGPGSTVIVLAGTYDEQIWLTTGGSSHHPITLRSQEKHGAKIRPPANAYSTINIQASHVAVLGFDVVGGTGHAIDASTSPVLELHHVRIADNLCHHSGGSGISAAYGDFFTIEDNICHDNCSTNGFQTSGISLYQARASSTKAQGYRNIIRRNICFSNSILDIGQHAHTDGNGIIVDDLQNTQGESSAGNFRFPTLVENNLCYNNGGKGIQIFLSDNCTVRNNTCYKNNRDLDLLGGWDGEINNAFSSDNVFVNNIAWADPFHKPTAHALGFHAGNGYNNNNVLFCRNLTYNGVPGDPSVSVEGTGGNASLRNVSPYDNLLGVDPQFMAARVSPNADFRLRAGSPAVNSGTDAFGAPLSDLTGRQRRAPVDLGCHEYAGRRLR